MHRRTILKAKKILHENDFISVKKRWAESFERRPCDIFKLNGFKKKCDYEEDCAPDV